MRYGWFRCRICKWETVSMTIELEFFPESALALNKEIENHPRLQLLLHALGPDAPLEEKFAAILFYCGMLVDGYYDNTAMEKLFDVCIEKLKKMSEVVAAVH